MKTCETCYATVNAECFALHMDWHTGIDNALIIALAVGRSARP